ncbi:c-type cytochrome [Croceivirga thetidis]|uniref:C-type cytochrome n=1 Tax=Croceivirga thetidis TaxID=2721623 RepID=A0ABX1GPS5_9FLAO|nr:c-type cytochrome [Croceivirga thetidis]NKI31928.1 c-type cytochrome [Croceivirga thetidis]
MKYQIRLFAVLICLIMGTMVFAQGRPVEENYYRITTVPVPEGIHLEGGGVLALPTGKLMVCTRRGNIWLIENPTMSGNRNPNFKKFASGLHEPLGIARKNNAIYIAQRGELTKLVDTNGDEVADIYETIYAWPLTSHYHEYSFGPVIDKNGDFFVTANVSFSNAEWWRGISEVPWRGWTMKITEDGQMEPWATGMRSPAGYGMYEGELFYSDNQGDWKGSGGVWHLPKGAFTGHPAGLAWTNHPDSPIKLTEEQFYAKIDKRQKKVNGSYIKPENIENEEDPDFEYEAQEYFDELQLPAVILPHGLMGISNSEIIEDDTNGKFGPFSGQLLVGDQGQSKIMRVGLEKVKGKYQGFAIDFLSGFQSGVMRMDFDNQGNLFVGETNRGWGSAGTTNDGLEYVTWTGELPFEIENVKAMPDGFEISFTQPIAIDKAEFLDSYYGKSYVYKYHAVYGSPQTNVKELKPKGVKVSENGYSLRLVYDELRQYYVHELSFSGIYNEDGNSLLHPTIYYTLNEIPDGEKLPASVLSTKRKPKKKVVSTARKKTSKKKPLTTAGSKKITFEEVEPLLQKNTCFACHQSEKKVVGPSYKDIAKRKYSDERIVELIYNPEPKNWPEYATPMAPMPQVPRDEALKIAAWINTLRDY